jgi:hypothetical protein
VSDAPETLEGGKFYGRETGDAFVAFALPHESPDSLVRKR